MELHCTHGIVLYRGGTVQVELSICKIATIAARLIRGGVDQNPPTVDLYWGADYGRIVQSIVIRIRCIVVWICRIGIAVIVRRMELLSALSSSSDSALSSLDSEVVSSSAVA